MKTIVLTVALICSAFSLLAGQVRVGGFWGEQYRNLTVNWLPHCVKMMEAGGEGEEMPEAHGHAVRANYFYTTMAQIPATRAAAERVFANIVDRKMYLTGGVGSDYKREAYGVDYDLPQMAYAESYAGCGLAFFAQAIGGNIQGLQCAGHMDLVHVSGNDYLAVFLGVRAYGPDKRILLGRETFACPVIWRDGDLIVKDAELIEGRLVTPEPWYTVALADSKVRLRRLAHYIFDETIEVAPGESAVLYRNKGGFMAWPNETSETVRIRLVSEDGLTVSAFCNDAPLGGTRDLKPLVDAARKSRFNGLGIGVLGK